MDERHSSDKEVRIERIGGVVLVSEPATGTNLQVSGIDPVNLEEMA